MFPAEKCLSLLDLKLIAVSLQDLIEAHFMKDIVSILLQACAEKLFIDVFIKKSKPLKFITLWYIVIDLQMLLFKDI